MFISRFTIFDYEFGKFNLRSYNKKYLDQNKINIYSKIFKFINFDH